MTTYSTLTLRTETFGIRPELEHVSVSRRRALQTDKSTGHVIRRVVNERQKRTFILSWADAAEGIAVLLEERWEAAYGPVLSMAYTPVDKTDADALDVRFIEGSLQITQASPGSFQIRVVVEEVL